MRVLDRTCQPQPTRWRVAVSGVPCEQDATSPEAGGQDPFEGPPRDHVYLHRMIADPHRGPNIALDGLIGLGPGPRVVIGGQPDPFLEGTLSGLAFNRGQRGRERGPHAPAAFAAHELWASLRRDGVSIRGPSGASAAPPGAQTLAVAQSPPLASILGLMLPLSDNFFAETLVKDLGARFGGAGTTAAGAAVVSRTIATDFGLHPHVVDGSGLSESDLTSPFEVGRLLIELASNPIGPVLRSRLAVAGHTGTLELRMRDTGASGRCEAKTGTLTHVSNLAGYCTTQNGQQVVFAFFNDGISTEAAHTFQDHMAISIADSEL